jgi:hypothetical protein
MGAVAPSMGKPGLGEVAVMGEPEVGKVVVMGATAEPAPPPPVKGPMMGGVRPMPKRRPTMGKPDPFGP